MALEKVINVEENDWTDWDNSTPTPSSGNRWEVVAAAALRGTSYGMRYTAANSQMTGDGAADITNTPAGGEYFRIAFPINRNTIAYAGTNGNQIIHFLDVTDDIYKTAEISLGYQGSWEIEARVLSTGGTQTYLTASLGTGERTVELRGLRSSADGQTDGGYWLYVDGSLVDSLTSIDNYDEVKPSILRLKDERPGASQAPTGIFYLDEIQLREDDTPIYPAANAFRFLGMAADTGKLYVVGPKDGVLSLYEYDLATLTEGGTVDTFGGATDAEIDSGARGVRPVVGPMADGVLYLFGRDGNDVQVQRDDNGGGWTDLGPGTGTWVATKVARALMPDALAGADLIAAFDDDDIYRSYDEGVSWVKMGDATPTGLAAAARHPTAGNEIILAGDSAGVIYQSHNFGVSDQDISPSGGGVPSSRTVDLRVAAGGNDGYAIQTLGVYISTSLTILFGNTASRQYEACLRFINMPIPAGATITAAYVELVAATTGSGTLSMNISAEDADNPAAVTGYSDFYARLRTTANSTWAVPDFVVGQVYQTVDISGAVQEVVNRAGWAEGQAMQVFIDTVSGSVNRQAVAYDDVPASAALLHVAYSVTQPMGIAQAIAFSL